MQLVGQLLMQFNNGELHLPDRDILESVYVNKDHISIIYSDIWRVSKGKDYFSENYETVRVDRNTGEWKYTYIYKLGKIMKFAKFFPY